MALTPRQKQFYEALVALCCASGQSAHYSAVAGVLGVSPFSAYDMLKVLEEKGVVASEYVLEGHTSGPGRSAICFRPCAQNVEARAVSGPEEAEWTGFRQRLLECLAEVRDGNVLEVLNEVLGRLAEQTSPLGYCTGVVAALLVNLRAAGRHVLARAQLQALVSSGEVGLATLAGLSIGSSLERLRDVSGLEALVQSARRFQVQLATLSGEGRQRLGEFLREALVAIEASEA